jgi:hypothetical protein
MGQTVKVESILSQINKLDYETRLYLIERLVKELRKNKKEVQQHSHELTELNSLGSEIWKDIDIDQYVQQERQWE